MKACDNYLPSKPISQIQRFPDTFHIPDATGTLIDYKGIRVNINECHGSKVSVRIPAVSDCAIILTGTKDSPDSVSIDLYAEHGNILPTQEAGKCWVFLQNAEDTPVLIGVLTSTHTVIDRNQKGWNLPTPEPVPVNYLKCILVRPDPEVLDYYRMISCNRPVQPAARQPRNESIPTRLQKIYNNMPRVTTKELFMEQGYYGQSGYSFDTLENNVLLQEFIETPSGPPSILYLPPPLGSDYDIGVGPLTMITREFPLDVMVEMDAPKRDSIGEAVLFPYNLWSWYQQWTDSSDVNPRLRYFRRHFPGTEVVTDGATLTYRFGGIPPDTYYATPSILLLPFYVTTPKTIRVTLLNLTTPTSLTYRLGMAMVSSRDDLLNTSMYEIVTDEENSVELIVDPIHAPFYVFRMITSGSPSTSSRFYMNTLELRFEEKKDGQWIPMDLTDQYLGSEFLDNRIIRSNRIQGTWLFKIYRSGYDADTNTNLWIVR